MRTEEFNAIMYMDASGFRETLRSDIDVGRFQPPGQRNPNMNLVIVSHGLTLRVFLMRWYKWTVEQFEGLNNFRNGKALVMEKGYGGRYFFFFSFIFLAIFHRNLNYIYILQIQYYYRYSLLVHHTEEELREFGLTDDMLMDQEW